MKVLLTGATGFLGRSVARHLDARGHALRVLVRATSRLEGLPDGTETAIGDVTDAVSFARAAEGCAAILHMAALVKVWVPDPERFEATNLGGFRNALAAARAAGRSPRLHVVVHRARPLGPGRARRHRGRTPGPASAIPTSGPRPSRTPRRARPPRRATTW